MDETKTAPPAERTPAPVAEVAPPTVHELVAKHIAEATKEHLTVLEHLELRGHKMELRSTAPGVMEPSLPPIVAGLAARFKGQGMHHEARISKEAFEAALHEHLHGRI